MSRDAVHVWRYKRNMVTSEQRRPTVDQTLPEDPLDTEPVFKWFEVALCERGEDGQVIVKDRKKSLIPEYTFYEGLHPGKYYAQAARRVEARDGTVFIGDWTDLSEWRKPTRARE